MMIATRVEETCCNNEKTGNWETDLLFNAC